MMIIIDIIIIIIFILILSSTTTTSSSRLRLAPTWQYFGTIISSGSGSGLYSGGLTLEHSTEV